MIRWRESIHSNGFAVIPDVFPEQDISSFAEELSRGALQRSRAGIRHALRHSSVARLASHPRLVCIAKCVLGDSAVAFRATLFDKSLASNWLVVWHQDTALPLREKRETPGWGPWSVKDGVIYAHAPARALEQVLALRVHLDDSTAENGPLRVLPGTHRTGLLQDGEIHKLAADSSAVDCVVRKGGVIAMRPLILHASSKSLSNLPRRVLHIEYSSSTQFENGLELASA
jgi:ectoine hydroxylase-related dioxygenase (phytanoyl-CoA dioxygenase family)